MDSSGMEVLCKNSTFGCVFASSSAEDMVKHFQSECPFHPLQCFKCTRMVPKMNFAKHYEQCCKASSASPCSPLEEAPDAAEATASATAKSREEHFLRESVTECAVCVKSLYRAMEVVAADIAEAKGMKEKQHVLEAIVRGQGDVIRELGKSIMMVAEKVNKLQQDVSGLANKLEKDAEAIVRRVEDVDGSVYKLEKDVGAMVERVENVDGLVKESKLGVERLSRVMNDVAADVAEMKRMREEQQDLVPNVKQQGDLVKELEKTVLTSAEKINKVEQDVGTIVQRVKKVDGVIGEVRTLTNPLADQSRIHWYVENVGQHIERAKTGKSHVDSEVFVVRGYSVTLRFRVQTSGGRLCIGLFFLLCRGPNDSLLQWPFRIPYTLSLVHPKDASKSKEYKVTPPSTDPKRFEKPKDAKNAGRGTGSLCTVEEAQNEGFIENDAVCVSVTLHG